MANRDGLIVRTSDTGEGAVFDRFFAGYDKAFVLPDEKEDRDGFAACLALNHGSEKARLTALYGEFTELVLTVEEADGPLIGGANFIAAPLPEAQGRSIATANLNYLYVDPAQRGRGRLKQMMAIVVDTIRDAFGVEEVLIFLEQNDPFAMDEAAYRLDSQVAGVDQLDRLRIWARRGARILDWRYIQPALTPDQQPDDSLLYALIGLDAPLPACWLAAHLRRFYGISVRKGAPLDEDPVASDQLAALDARCADGDTIPLLDPAPLLARLPSREAATALFDRFPETMLDAIRTAD
ncbi:hypothetical protein FPZ54_01260 [Sphingomonas suaedae]|uniref:N-acetyltransferase domain-containing protein n=1 Tax=Sphingomonas suaedae TaxID=2599297 RepID=A0A518RBE8_9SPHN|nr:hypothetical protein [Sphingomonas suaedae]QDX24795.1 hypothetical protein FPZ54_01260 [Sphingomonas suaedae]